MRALSIKSILFGAVTVLVVDTVFSIVLASDLGVFDDPRATRSVMSGSPAFVGALFYGTIATIVGGYVAGLLAKRAYYVNAGVVGALGVVLGAFTVQRYPLWFSVASLVSTIPAALLGGVIAKRQYGKVV